MDKYSLRGQVFQEIREDILKGKFKENEELREATLGKELGVSRTPVREALRQLELEGLVHIIPNKGAYVTGITEKDVHDIYMTRSMLEGLCARWAAEHISEEQIQEMEEVLLLTEYHLDRGNAEQLAELDGKFHEVLYDASQSRILRHILSDFHKYVQVARKRSVKKEDRAKKSLEEHREILNALRTGDADRAEELAHIHILNVMENLHIEQE
ncbi:GntR family transcriptional regulator [Coprococcus catus]|uniref:GntR family transcriptional regulator n=1 Tax=Lachnospiraceae TaxID=186803 RepID=UPI002A269D46|nr:GntR family transcriptional regulator [bacterium]MDD6515149.1 GntR family transcriptional regulator [bacterium]MDY2886088.1 GntR family transcriptional regulator [Bariatricus sp.]